MTKHTPGPWSASWAQNNVLALYDKDGKHFANFRNVRGDNRAVVDSDARHIINAPEMHQVLTELLEWCRSHTSPTDPNSPHEILVRATAVLARCNNTSD
jgi:hypothetical protein